jgi:hypothetical protein
MPNYGIWIIVGILSLVICYMIYDRAENRREIRRLRQGNAELLKMRCIHRVPVTPTIVHEESLEDAINDALRRGEQDYSHIIAPYESRKSKF